MNPETKGGESSLSVLNKVTPVSKYLALFLFVTLPFVGAWVGYTYAPLLTSHTEMSRYAQNTYHVQTSNPSQATPFETNEFVSNVANIKFTIPLGWSGLEEDPETLPVGMVNPLFVLSDGSDCLIAGVPHMSQKVMREKYTEYSKISYASRIVSPTFQWDGGWYAKNSSTSITVQTTRQFLKNEIRIASDDEIIDFILWNKNGDSVSLVCDGQLNNLLKTVRHHYSDVDLYDNSKGLMSIKLLRGKTRNQDQSNLILKKDSGETFRIMPVPTYFGHGNDVYVTNSKLIGSGGSTVLEIDPLSKQKVALIDIADKNKYIASLFYHDKKLYFLATSNELRTCMDKGSKTCLSELYEYNLETKQTTLLAKDFAATKILGYEKDKNTFYVTYGYGDGGECSFTMTGLTNGLPTESLIYGCLDDSRYPIAPLNRVREIMNLNTYPTSDTVEIKNKTLLKPAVEKTDSSYTRFIFVD